MVLPPQLPAECVARLGGNPRPATSDEAIVSIPYLVARTLAHPESVTKPLTAEFSIATNEAGILERIRIHDDVALADHAARILIRDGERESSCRAARGTSARKLTAAEVIDKFRAICGLEHPEKVIQDIMEGDASLANVIRSASTPPSA